MLPQEFITYTSSLFGEERWQRYIDSFSTETPVSIRKNPFKQISADAVLPDSAPLTEIGDEVPWCRNAYYLNKRPDFTLDPLLHAGVYYVQEASSMFLDTVLQQYLHESPITALDLCASPGGKSTLLRAALPKGSLLMCNEPDRRRANILMENMQKQGHPDVIVTNNFAEAYKKSRLVFDLILADVPCSGEGMFRKDEATIGEWSLANVMKCASLQRSIIEDIWQSLKPGGILIYSTCTFNVHENEENVRWICDELGAEVMPVNKKEEWNIVGSLLEGWNEPVSRFIPGTARGEGLFIAVIRKGSDDLVNGKPDMKALRILSDGHPVGVQKGKDIIPAHSEALLINTPHDKYPRVNLSYDDAIRYLRHEAIVLPPESPRGIVIVEYLRQPLGFVKNIGNRANNLYPQEWKIRK